MKKPEILMNASQMCHETGVLEYTGDVKPNQNNFTGIGATGGGLPGTFILINPIFSGLHFYQ